MSEVSITAPSVCHILLFLFHEAKEMVRNQVKTSQLVNTCDP